MSPSRPGSRSVDFKEMVYLYGNADKIVSTAYLVGRWFYILKFNNQSEC